MRLEKVSRVQRSGYDWGIVVRPTGLFTFSRAVSYDLVLFGMCVTFYNDRDSELDWYIGFSSDGEYGFRRNGHNVMFGNKNLYIEICRTTKNVFEKLDIGISRSFIEHDGIKLYPLLISKGDIRG